MYTCITPNTHHSCEASAVVYGQPWRGSSSAFDYLNLILQKRIGRLRDQQAEALLCNNTVLWELIIGWKSSRVSWECWLSIWPHFLYTSIVSWLCPSPTIDRFYTSQQLTTYLHGVNSLAIITQIIHQMHFLNQCLGLSIIKYKVTPE